jgi:hypothetical protein
MSKADFRWKLDKACEITLSVKGRKSGQDFPWPVWFVNEGNTLYLLPLQGVDTNWFNNIQAEPTLKIAVDNDGETTVRGTPITNSSGVASIVKKFRSKYGEGNVKRYYPKTDAAVEVPL